MNIAFLGIGLMGLPMAKRLAAAGHHLSVWNRTSSKADPLAVLGARVAHAAAAAVRHADIVICMLEDGPSTADVLFNQGTAAALRPGALWITMASTQPAEARDHAKRLEAYGVAHLDAPVSGGTLGAEQGNLAILCGGSAADFERAKPVFATLGRATLLGGTGCGQLCKLANQLIVGVSIAAVAEALLLVQKGGANPEQFAAAVAGGFADSRILQVHGQRMLERDFAKRAAMAVQLKDMRNISATAAETGADLPTAALIEQLYFQACLDGLGDLDHSALFRALAVRNGVV